MFWYILWNPLHDYDVPNAFCCVTGKENNVETVNITKLFCEMLPNAYCRVIMQQVSSFWIGSINTSVVNINMNCFPYIPSTVNEQGQFNKTFTSVAIVLEYESNSYACKSSIKLTPE